MGKCLARQARLESYNPLVNRIGQPVMAILEACLVLRVSVSATLQFIHIAAGRMDVFWQYSQVRSGLVVGALLVGEAGGAISDTHGRLEPDSNRETPLSVFRPGLSRTAWGKRRSKEGGLGGVVFQTVRKRRRIHKTQNRRACRNRATRWLRCDNVIHVSRAFGSRRADIELDRSFPQERSVDRSWL